MSNDKRETWRRGESEEFYHGESAGRVARCKRWVCWWCGRKGSRGRTPTVVYVNDLRRTVHARCATDIMRQADADSVVADALTEEEWRTCHER